MKRSMMCLLGLGALVGFVAAPGSGRAQEEKPYTVEDGKVDKGTYNGYRRYGDACLRCHGQAGAGSPYAPALKDSLQRLSYEQFTEVVINGKQGGTNKVMPAFGEVEDVATYIDDIYGYLKAISDGAIGSARPERIKG